MSLSNKIDVLYFSIEEDLETHYIFGLNGVDLQRTEDENAAVDFIAFPAVRIFVGLGSPESERAFLEELRNHPNYDFAKKNPEIPIIFYHRFEFLYDEVYDIFIKLVCEELNRKPNTLILLDSCVGDRKGVINVPKFIQIRQFHLKSSIAKIDRLKKFSFLTNRNNKLRSQILDKVLYEYENDVDLFKSENIVSFRNYKDNNSVKGPSNDISDIKTFIEESHEYKFKNDFEFFNSINLPWVIDDFSIGLGFQEMQDSLHDFYSHCYYSLIVETEYFYSPLDFVKKKEFNMAFSEKGIIPFYSHNLPFIITHSDYYLGFEKIGLDFSYLKTLFDIDYRTNTLKENFESIEKFVSYFKENDLDTIKKDFARFSHIIENNIEILKKIENRESTQEVFDFFQKIKDRRYE